jgi:hypothetical protein
MTLKEKLEAITATVDLLQLHNRSLTIDVSTILNRCEITIFGSDAREVAEQHKDVGWKRVLPIGKKDFNWVANVNGVTVEIYECEPAGFIVPEFVPEVFPAAA